MPQESFAKIERVIIHWTLYIEERKGVSYDFSFDAENEFLMWNDNSVVTLATNSCTTEQFVAA